MNIHIISISRNLQNAYIMQENTKLQYSKNKAKVYLNSTSLSQEIYYKNSLSIANNLGICFSKKISKKMILKKKEIYENFTGDSILFQLFQIFWISRVFLYILGVIIFPANFRARSLNRLSGARVKHLKRRDPRSGCNGISETREPRSRPRRRRQL